MACTTIAYLTMKGGVGKTTLAANVTRAMADRGPKRSILLIDADAQCNLSQIFVNAEEIEKGSTRSIYQTFDAGYKTYEPADLVSLIYRNPDTGSNIDLLRGSLDTFSFVVAPPAKQIAAQQRFQNFMRKAQATYDIIVIDTNPSATFATLQALNVSNFLVAPITFDSFAMRGVEIIRNTLKERYEWLDNDKRFLLVPNKIPRAADMQARLAAKELEVKDRFPQLELAISNARIHLSAYLDGDLERRGHGFAIDTVNHAGYRESLRTDFGDVALTLDKRIETAFGNETKNKNGSTGVIREAFKSWLGGAVAGH